MAKKEQDFTSYFYSNAIIPRKFTICGLELKPFCLGHLLILEHTQNPIVNINAQDTTLEDSIYYFFHALLVCGLNYEENLTLLDNSTDYKEYVDKFTQNMLKNMEHESDWNILKKLNMFEKYVKFHMEMPLYSEEQNQDISTPSGTDWRQNLFLIFKKLGYDESEILNMNFKKMFYEWASYSEAEGAIKVMNRIDIEQLNNAKKRKI
jgi:hypothetical protein